MKPQPIQRVVAWMGPAHMFITVSDDEARDWINREAPKYLSGFIMLDYHGSGWPLPNYRVHEVMAYLESMGHD